MKRSTTWLGVTAVIAAGSWGSVCGAATPPPSALDDADVVWDTPGQNSTDSMPLGNGDIGLNLWAGADGDLCFYISKTDAWNGDNNLLKVGRVRLKITPNPFRKGAPFRQQLRLKTADALVTAGSTGEVVSVRIWVDANAPVIHLETTSEKPVDLQVSIETPWRAGDVYLAGQKDRVVWYRRNTTSCWADIMKAEGLFKLPQAGVDPFLNRTFGGLVEGSGFATVDAAHLRAAQVTSASCSIFVLTAQTATPAAWLTQLEGLVAKDEARGNRRRAAHEAWWREFWARSWIRIQTDPALAPAGDSDTGQRVARQYARQRFVNACASRGAYPIKFNGSIFTFERFKTGNANIDRGFDPSQPPDPDFRFYGGNYWFQNTRLIYWPMLASGDYDLLQPFFQMYRGMLPLCLARTELYCGHAGAFYPEMLTFFGAYGCHAFNPALRGKPEVFLSGPYTHWHWNGELELLAMMADYYDQTEDAGFLQQTLLPLADAVFQFYDQHYRRDDKGRLAMHPAQALETWWDTTNPLPDVAGLRWDLGRLLALPARTLGSQRREAWQKLLAAIPPLPVGDSSKEMMLRKAIPTAAYLAQVPLTPAEKVVHRSLLPAEKFTYYGNCENPELYAVFPYRFYGIGRPDLEVGRNTMANRICSWGFCWDQTPIDFACLGETREAKQWTTQRLLYDSFRFPVFYRTSQDWFPDEDHAGVGMMALQCMLLQTDGDKILLFPAWPKEWNVEFKLHGPRRTTVEGVYRNGKLETLRVTPRARRKDVIVMAPN